MSISPINSALTISNIQMQDITKQETQVSNCSDLPKPALLPLDNEKSALTCFLLMVGDFMGLKATKYFPNARISLTFLIQNLQNLKTLNLIDSVNLETLLKRLQTAYIIADAQYQLSKTATVEEYKKNRTLLSRNILGLLEQEKKVLIPCGYAAGKKGHHVILELTMDDYGIVHGAIINSGAGIFPYHTAEVSEKLKYHRLKLNDVSLDQLHESCFLDYLLDLQMGQLLPSETEHSVNQNTLHTMTDFYEAVLPCWPTGIYNTLNQEIIGHTPQNSGSCTLQPFLYILKEILGQHDGEITKAYLSLCTAENILKFVNLENYDLNRIKDAIAKFSRHAYSLQVEQQLPSCIKQKSIEISDRLLQNIQEIKKRREKIKLNQEIDLSHTPSSTNQGVHLSLGRSMFDSNSQQPSIPLTLPTFQTSNFKTYLEQADQILENALQAKQLKTAQQLAYRVLLEIPSPQDNFWDTLHNGVEIRTLNKCAHVLLKAKNLGKAKPLAVTPNEHALFLKATIIALKQAELAGVPAQVLEEFKGYLKNKLFLSSFVYTHPTFVRIYAESLAYLKEVHLPNSKLILKPTLDKTSHYWYFDLPVNTESLQAILKDPELCYIHDFLQQHSTELDNTSDKKIIQKIAAYYSDCLFDPETKRHNPTFENTEPIWEPLRHLTVTRSLFFCFQTASIVGETSGYSEAKLSILLYTKHKGSKHVSFSQIRPNSPDDYSSNLFLNTFHQFSREGQRFVEKILDYEPNQNKILSNTFSKTGEFNLSQQQAQYLQTIKTTDGLSLPQLIGFFSQHFYTLKEPHVQALFSHLLFALKQEDPQSVLYETLTNSSLIKEQLFHFLKQGLEHAQRLKWHECHLFFLRTLGLVASFVAETHNAQLLEKTRLLLEKQMQMLLNAKLNQTEASQLYFTLISLAPYFDHPSLQPLLAYCMKAKVTAQQINVTPSPLFGNQGNEDYLLGDQKLNAQHSLDMLPLWVVGHKDYIFESNFKVQTIQEGLYSFKNAQGDLYRIATQDQSFRTYRYIEGVWYEHRKELPSCTSSFSNKHPYSAEGYFGKGTRIWYSCEEPKRVLISSIESDKIICIVTEEGIFHPTHNRKLVLDYSVPVIDLLSNLSAKTQILAWKNPQNEIVEIDLPEFNVQFKCSDKKWYCSQYPGYFLDAKQCLPCLDPCRHYVILKDEKGKRLAIMPNFGLESKQENGFDPIQLHSSAIIQPACLLAFSVNKEGTIKYPENGDSALYLIYLALRKRDYQLAKKHLIHFKKMEPDWTEAGAFWINALEENTNEQDTQNDKHPDAIALRIQLRQLVQQSDTESLNIQQINGLRSDYFKYLELKTHVTSLPLTDKEELKCIKVLKKNIALTQVESYRLATREHQISDMPLPEQGTVFNTPYPKKKDDDFTLSFFWITDEIENTMRACLANPRPIALYTRPGSAFIANFLYYYSIATTSDKDSPEYQELITLLRLSRFMNDKRMRSLHAFLLYALTYPKKVPHVQTLISRSLKYALVSDPDMMAIAIRDWHWGFMNAAKISGSVNYVGKADVKIYAEYPSPEVPQHTWRTPGIHHFLEKTADYFICQAWEEKEKEIAQDLHLLHEMETFLQIKDQPECIKREFTRLVDGIREKSEALHKILNKQTPSYLLNFEKSAELKSFLQDQHIELSNKIKESKKQILKIAQNYPDNIALSKNGHKIVPLSFKQLIVFFGTQDDQAILASNPSLDSQQLANLKSLICEYLILSGDYQQLLSLTKKLEELQKSIQASGPDSANSKNASVACVNIACEERIYDPHENPHLLVFEYFSKKRIRQEQYDALMDLTNGKKNIDFEARTGFGKSQVLITLWLYLMSKKNRVAMMTVPASLFAFQRRYLKKILGKAFDSQVLCIQFDRTKANDLRYLKKLNKKLECAKKEHKILLTTVQSLHGMVNLKMKEALANGVLQQEHLGELSILRKKIAQDVSDFFDESKECFNIRHRYDYAIGSPTSVDSKLFERTCKLYKTLFLESSLGKTFNFEFLSSQKDKPEVQKPVLKKLYEAELLPPLAELAATQLGVPEKFKKAVLADLQGHYTKECELYYDTLSKDQLAEYELIKKQLTIHLRRSLFKKYKDEYTFRKKTRLAIPAVDGAARHQSEFSTVEDYVDFTIQANLKKPFALQHIRDFVDPLKLKALNKEQEVTETLAYSVYQQISGRPILECDEEYMQEILTRINSNYTLKLAFIEAAILPQIKIYQEKIASSSFNLIRSIDQVQAASGTVNPDALPPKIQTQENKTAIIENLMVLWKNSQDRIFILKGAASQDEFLNLLKERTKESVLIDVAGRFRDLNLTQTAETILSVRPLVKGVLLYNEEGRAYIYDREIKALIPQEDSPHNPEDLFIFIRKSKAIGTDTTMPLSAEAIVTVDRDTNADLFFQGTGRMRKLKEGQIVGYALSEEDAVMIFQDQPQQFKLLVRHVLYNQGLQKAEDAFYILRLYLEDLIDVAFWEGIDNCPTLQEKDALFAAFRMLLVKKTQTKPLSTLRQQKCEMATKDAVASLKEDLLSPVKEFKVQNPKWSSLFNIEKIETAFDAFVDYSKLPEKIALQNSEEQMSIVEAQTTDEDNQSEQTTEQNNLAQNAIETPVLKFKASNPLPWEGSLSSLFTAHYETLLRTQVYFSPNFDKVSKNQQINQQVQKPAYQCLIQQNPDGKYAVCFLDLYDAECVLEKILAQPKELDDNNYFLFSGSTLIASTSSNAHISLRSKNFEMLTLRILQKLFSASFSWTHEEQKHLIRFSQGEYSAFVKHAEQLKTRLPSSVD